MSNKSDMPKKEASNSLITTTLTTLSDPSSQQDYIRLRNITPPSSKKGFVPTRLPLVEKQRCGEVHTHGASMSSQGSEPNHQIMASVDRIRPHCYRDKALRCHGMAITIMLCSDSIYSLYQHSFCRLCSLP